MQKTSNDILISGASAYQLLKRENQLLSHRPSPIPVDETPHILVTDSRQVVEGSIYLAFIGVSKDGHDYIADVLKKKPSLLIVENKEKVPPGTTCPVLVVASGRRAWALLCAHACGNPEKDLRLVAVTGTNGKTSTVWHLKHLLAAKGERVLSLGTLGAYLEDQFIPTTHTTPDPPVLFPLLSEAKKAGITTAVMEASSHALFQEKLAPLSFACCIFTSFTRDHLDLHGSMDEYFAQKKRLFSERAKGDAQFLFSASLGDNLRQLKEFASKGVVYGFHAKAAAERYQFKSYVEIFLVNTRASGSTCRIETQHGSDLFEVPLLGSFALENFLAAKLATETLLQQSVTAQDLKSLKQVPGRLDLIAHDGEASPMVLVDYAHTPDALEKALAVLKAIPHDKLWVVFGCGGDRDAGKRPIMGALATSLADHVIVTSDNPRMEDPLRIIDDIMTGVPRANAERVRVVADRALAIKSAIKQAGAKDIVLIAGKGHEDYMEICDMRIHFSDHEHARNALKSDICDA